jgi:hypothetical protein
MGKQQIFQVAEQEIERNRMTDIDTLEQSIDESTQYGDIILEEGIAQINSVARQLFNCNSRAQSGESLCEELDQGVELYNEFLVENELGSIDENGEVCPTE